MMEKERVNQLYQQYPLLKEMASMKCVLWLNQFEKEHELVEDFTFDKVLEAEQRLKRFSSYLKVAFPETENCDGIIESEIKDISSLRHWMQHIGDVNIQGKLLLKCDHALPISGSIKARGGIYEVLKFAEHLALEHQLIRFEDNYSIFHSESFRKFFNQYKIAVGSTGNLGLSIGMIGAKLGFQVTVHMSADAKEWKKQLLRHKGVEVIEYASDYSKAVEEGRKQAELDPKCHFIDDENSQDLFSGYAVAALRLQKQLKDANIIIDANHPLFVYLPCGVGGGPGGVAYGLKQLYGEHVHIFFGEPLQSPCMLIGMMTGLHDNISVVDIGLNNKTEADGLAVGRASKFVGKIMEPIISGCYTVDDTFLFESLRALNGIEQIFAEPSAHAGVYGPISLFKRGQQYLNRYQLLNQMEQATHLIWSTGGNMVPMDQRQQYLQKI